MIKNHEKDTSIGKFVNLKEFGVGLIVKFDRANDIFLVYQYSTDELIRFEPEYMTVIE